MQINHREIPFVLLRRTIRRAASKKTRPTCFIGLIHSKTGNSLIVGFAFRRESLQSSVRAHNRRTISCLFVFVKKKKMSETRSSSLDILLAQVHSSMRPTYSIRLWQRTNERTDPFSSRRADFVLIPMIDGSWKKFSLSEIESSIKREIFSLRCSFISRQPSASKQCN